MKYYRNKNSHEEIYTWDEKERHPFSNDPIIIRNGVKWEFGKCSGVTNRERLEEFNPWEIKKEFIPEKCCNCGRTGNHSLAACIGGN